MKASGYGGRRIERRDQFGDLFSGVRVGVGLYLLEFGLERRNARVRRGQVPFSCGELVASFIHFPLGIAVRVAAASEKQGYGREHGQNTHRHGILPYQIERGGEGFIVDRGSVRFMKA